MDNLGEIHDQLDKYLRKTSLLPGDLDTPFSKFATANAAPNHQDIRHIDVVVFQRSTQLAALASQMTSVDNAIQKLVAIRNTLRENSAHIRRSLLAHQALTSPLRRIPPEVLGEVFYHCLPKTSYISPSNVDAPMVLTQVCYHWRTVAMSTPSLWSSLSIHLQKTVCEAYRHGCEAWLSRAKTIPLVIRVLNDVNMFATDPALLSSTLHWLRSFIAHCSDLWWHGPSLPIPFITENEIERHLPLQRLRITSHRDTPSIQFPSPATRLRSVSLQCLNYDLQSLDGIRLPWDNLVELSMHFALFSSTLFVHLLTRCGHLHTLVVSCLCADEGQLAALRLLPPGSVTQPTLRRVEIKVIRAGLGMIFDALTLPALEELDVCFCYRERDAWPHASFIEMVARSQCVLKRLTVRSNKNAVSFFGEYIKAMPGLAVFTSAPDLLS